MKKTKRIKTQETVKRRGIKKGGNNKWFQYILDHFDYDNDYGWNFSKLSANPNVTWEIVQANPEIPWDYEELSRNPSITWDIIQANPDGVNGQGWSIEFLSINPNITWDIIQANPNPFDDNDNTWNYNMMTGNPNITWDIIQANPGLPWYEDLLWDEEYEDKPNYILLSRNPSITWDNVVSSIRLNQDIEWDYVELSANPNITWDIVRTNPTLPWKSTLSVNPNITWDIVQANPTGVNGMGWSIEYLSKNPNITWDIIEANPDGVNGQGWDYGRYLSQNPNITWEIVEAHPEVDWSFNWLSSNPMSKHPFFSAIQGSEEEEVLFSNELSCMDFIEGDDKTINTYLSLNRNNFVIGNQRGEFTCANLNDLKAQHRSDSGGTGNQLYKTYFECKPDAPAHAQGSYRRFVPQDAKEFVKLTGPGGGFYLTLKPNWLWTGPVPSPRVFLLVEKGTVNKFVTNQVYPTMTTQFNFVGADHCNQTSPITYYALEPYRQGGGKKTVRNKNKRKNKTVRKKCFK